MLRYDAGRRSAGLAYVLWFFLGWFGLHRFYLGRVGSGAAQLVLTAVSTVLTFVLVGYAGLAVAGIWWLVDALLIPGMADDYNRRLITRLGG